jgi:hypothetical protein
VTIVNALLVPFDATYPLVDVIMSITSVVLQTKCTQCTETPLLFVSFLEIFEVFFGWFEKVTAIFRETIFRRKLMGKIRHGEIHMT